MADSLSASEAPFWNETITIIPSVFSLYLTLPRSAQAGLENREFVS